MDEKYLEQLFNERGGAAQLGEYGEWKALMTGDDEYRQYFYNETGGEQVYGPYADFEGLTKKKDGGDGLVVSEDSQSRAQAAGPSLWASAYSQQSAAQQGLTSPATLLNARQLADYANAGGLVASPAQSRQIAADILGKPLSEAELQRDKLISLVDASFAQQRQSMAEGVRRAFFESGEAESFTPEAQQAQVSARVTEALSPFNELNAISFVDQALASKNYKAIRDVVNNHYGTQLEQLYNEAPLLASPPGEKVAPLRAEKNRANLLLDRVGAGQYSLINPEVSEAYGYDAVFGSPLSKELTPNQYSGLRYLQENNPEMYERFRMELAVAADPKQFGRESYDKQNRNYQYLLYTLDRRGQEINNMAIADKMAALAPEAFRTAQEYNGRLDGLSRQMARAKDYNERQNLQTAINQVQDEKSANPILVQYQALQDLGDQVQVDYNEKYPDQASRARENMVKDILEDEGLNLFQSPSVLKRLKWLFLNTATGLGNMTGGNELEFGFSGNYIRNLRRSEQESAELYTPNYSAATQALYKLNFSPRDYAIIKSIKDSDMETEQKEKAIADYLEANQDRIRYEENPEAGKRNWTVGAIGNQVADVGTQVLYQGALMMLAGGVGRTATSARAAAGTAGAGEVAAVIPEGLAAGLETSAENIASAAVRQGTGGFLKDKLADLGSIMGSSYVTAYQPAYAEALQQGKSPAEAAGYANQIALVNGLSEVISPDALVLKNAARGFRALEEGITPEFISTAKRLQNKASWFAQGYLKSTAGETLEEITAALGEYGTDQLYNMNQDELNSLNERIKNAAITTAVGMTPFGISTGASTVRTSSRMQREMFYQAGLYPDLIRDEINTLKMEGGITTQEANRRIQTVNTMRDIIAQLPPMDNGLPMPDAAKTDYAFNRLQQSYLEHDLGKATDENTKDFLRAQIDEYAEKNRRLLRGLGTSTAPADIPVTEEGEGDVPTPAAPATPTEGEPAAPITAPVFEVGQRLDTPDFGVMEIIDRHGEELVIRAADGQVDSFSPTEITEVLRPREVIQVTASPAPAAVPEGTTSPSIFVQKPSTQREAPVVTVGAPAATEISSPVNTTDNAVNQIIEQEGVQNERTQGDTGGQAPQTGGSDRLLPATEGQTQGQIAAPGPISEPAAVPVPSRAERVPVVETVEPVGEALDERMGLTQTQEATIGRMTKERLYDNILELDPQNEVQGQLEGYSRSALQGIYRGLVAREGGTAARERRQAVRAARTVPAPVAEKVRTAKSDYDQARQQLRDREREIGRLRPGNRDYPLRKAARDKARIAVERAETAYLAARKARIRELRQQRGDAVGITAGRTDAELIAEYIELAKVYARKGIRTVADFAAALGERLSPHLERGWDIAHSTDAPVQLQGEGLKAYSQRLTSWQKQQARTPSERKAATEKVRQIKTGLRKAREGREILRKDINTTRSAFNEQLGLPADDYLTYVGALKDQIASNPIKKRTASAVLRNLRRVDPRTVLATEMQLLRLRMAEQERGSKTGYKQAKKEIADIRAQVAAILKDAAAQDVFEYGELTSTQMEELLRRVNAIRNEEGLERFGQFMGQLVENAESARVLAEVEKLQARLGKLLKKKDLITANMVRKNQVVGGKNILQALRKVDPMSVENLVQLHDMLSNVVNSLEGKQNLEYSNETILDYLTAANQQEVAARGEHLKSRYTQALEYLAANLGADAVNSTQSAADFNRSVDQIVNDPGRSAEQKAQELNALRAAVLIMENQVELGGELQDVTAIYEQVRLEGTRRATAKLTEKLTPIVEASQNQLEEALENADFPADAQQRAWMDSIVKLDPTRLTAKQLVLTKNVIDNILVNQDFSGAGQVAVWSNAQQIVGADSAKYNAMDNTVNRDAFRGFFGNMFKNLSSSEQIIRTIANNGWDVAQLLLHVSRLGDIKSGHVQAKHILDDELTNPLKSIYKKYKGLTTPESIIKRGMYAYLNQNNYGTPQDQQREFDRRKAIIAEDIEKKSSPDVEDRQIQEEAKLARTIYEENFAGIDSQNELQSAGILNEGEQAVYQLFRDFYDRHKDDFREVVEGLLNRPFNDVNNYVRDAYKILEGSVQDIDLGDPAGSAFYHAKAPDSASTAALERNRFSTLEDIALRDELSGEVKGTRVLNYAFDTQQLNNAMGMLEDIYTLQYRMESQSTLRDARVQKDFGAANLTTLRKNVEKQVQSQMGLLQRQGIWVTDTVEKVADAVNKIGIRQVLFSFSQIVKQPADIVFNTLVNLGQNAGMFFQAMADYPPMVNTTNKEYLDKLFAQSEIGVRGRTFGGTNTISTQALTEIKQTIKGMAKDQKLEDPDKFSWFIEAPDTWAAKVAWAAYYAKSLKEQGLIQNYGEINWKNEYENINREARDYAELQTSSRLNVNAKESQSEFYAKTGGLGRLAQITFLPLSSYNMNNWALMYGDIKTLSNPQSNNEQKINALKSIASRMVAEVMFQTVRGGISLGLKAASSSVLGAAGIEPPEKKEEDFWWKVGSESIKNLFFGLLGNVGTEMVTNFINQLGEKTIDTKLLHSYEENPNIPTNNFGMISIVGNNALNAYNYVDDLINPVDANGNPIALTDSERVILAGAFLANMAGYFGYAEGDSKRIIETAARQITRRIDEAQGDPYYIQVGGKRSPNITIDGKRVEFTKEQEDFYNDRRQYYLDLTQGLEMSDQQKKREATERAKFDLQNTYGSDLKLVEKKKK